ncbi:unannotated protein [freshwater metagenome]|uniref:Unannotated protein n=1 Tax=freshwater metagenome TaxID=449393 RepID=A0A6J6A920_9ZZZZ
MIAFMIRFVSVSARRYTRLTGSPIVTVMVGGFHTFSSAGKRAERGHTCSVPHSPIGITGAFVIAARRAAPQRPFNTGS